MRAEIGYTIEIRKVEHVAVADGSWAMPFPGLWIGSGCKSQRRELTNNQQTVQFWSCLSTLAVENRLELPHRSNLQRIGALCHAIGQRQEDGVAVPLHNARYMYKHPSNFFTYRGPESRPV